MSFFEAEERPSFFFARMMGEDKRHDVAFYCAIKREEVSDFFPLDEMIF